jgi:hypothetical protein
MRVSRHRQSSVLFAVSAIGPIGVWFVLLFAVTPERQGTFEHAAHMFAYVSTGYETSWFFVLLALAPILLLGLAFVYWPARPEGGRRYQGLKWLGVLATLLSLAVCWPAAITSAHATYYAFRPGEA